MTTFPRDFRFHRLERRREFRRHLPGNWHHRHPGNRPVHQHPLRLCRPDQGSCRLTTHFVQRLHAINLGDGTDAAPLFLTGDTTNDNTNNTPIYVSGTGDGNVGGVVQFNALHEADRPALSLVNGIVYEEWASHGDVGPYHGWVVAWNVTNLSTKGMVLAGVLCTDPNGGEGGIWGGGGGLTFDPDETFNGQPAFYFETGNGDPRGGPPPLDPTASPLTMTITNPWSRSRPTRPPPRPTRIPMAGA